MEPEQVDLMNTYIIPAIAALAIYIFAKYFKKTPAVNAESLPPAISRWQSEAAAASRKYNVPVEIILAVISQESAGQPNVTGSAGEVGLMQLKKIAVTDLIENGYNVTPIPSQNPEQNIMQGAAFLSLQKKRVAKTSVGTRGNSWFNALWAYNQGYQGFLNGRLAGRSYAESVRSKLSKWGYEV